jgi:NAD(P)H-dependent flavin oxidoreductase YrpB (nitropropane dioxygenase family)
MPPQQLRTRLTELLGIEKPIIQGGHGLERRGAAGDGHRSQRLWDGDRWLVGVAGGLEGLRALVRECMRRTSKPFGVNFLQLNSAKKYNATADFAIEEGVTVVET